ncbi:lysosomal acid glucosylceramidase-like [Contarinia nasturtii]|uniref:lysosomal acid glucosylceramidase-like n=1 Tax=Contarinia nasturtii TaxID=265458 RepID=UPI0012D496AC|nr:lysosomal acid glucosylceramidase-like [Contarinia nasturtii]
MWTKFLLSLSLVLIQVLAEQTSRPCLQRWIDEDKLVCVCRVSENEEYCDTLDVPVSFNKNEAILVTSSRGGDRFNFTLEKFPRRYRNASVPAPFDVKKTYVKIKNVISRRSWRGWGGSYTDSMAYVTSLLPINLQRYVYKSLYSPDNGTNLSMLRIPIGSSKYSRSEWTYNQYPENDTSLTNFTMFNPEDQLKTSQLNELKSVAENPTIEYFAVASMAPQWMMRGVPHFKGVRNILKPEYYQTFADYHVKYLEMMNNQSINFTGISTGQRPDSSINEPGYSPLAWDPFKMGKWLALNLGPTLRTSNFEHVEIIGYDDCRQSIPLFISAMNVGNVNASKFITSIGIQNCKNRWFPPSVLDLTHAVYPTLPIYNTESSFPHIELGSWNNVEALVRDIIDNLQHDSQAYFLNNLILNLDGGPSLTVDREDAPILISDDSSEFYKQPIYYALAHFSKFITNGSLRLETYTSSSGILVTSFLRSDDTVVVILCNILDRIVPVVVIDLYQGRLELQLKPNSINTLIY